MLLRVPAARACRVASVAGPSPSPSLSLPLLLRAGYSSRSSVADAENTTSAKTSIPSMAYASRNSTLPATAPQPPSSLASRPVYPACQWSPFVAPVPGSSPAAVVMQSADRTFKSPTQRVIEVLRTGPKTSKQIYYAINQGPPANATAKAADAANTPEARAKAAAFNAAAISGKYPPTGDLPTGILRNPMHLRTILQLMCKGKRLWAKPYASIEARMGEEELASLQGLPANGVVSAGATSSAKKSNRRHLTEGHWVYVLRDWADPAYRKEGPRRMAKFQEKKARQQAKYQARAAEAAEKGLPFIPRVNKQKKIRTRDFKKEMEKKKEIEVNQAVLEYHKRLFPNEQQ